MSEKLVALVGELQEATQELDRANQAESSARMTQTEALNRVNKIQKAMDEELAKMRKNAHYSTDWNRSKGVQVA